AETAADLRAFFARHPRGLCLLVRGIDVDRPAEAEMVAQSLSFPVFSPQDPRAASRATPLLRALQRASFDDEAMTALFARCDLPNERACRLKRDRMASQLRVSLGKLQPGLGNLAADELPFHIGASGPFHLADADLLHVTLESSGEVPKANGSRSKLMIRYQPLWPESVAERRLQCQQQPGICLFRSLWNTGAGAADTPGEDGFESLVALFARRDDRGGEAGHGLRFRRQGERGPPRRAGELGRAAHRREQLLQSQVSDAGAFAAPGRQPEPERRTGGQRGAREGVAHDLRIVDRLSAAGVARRSGEPAAAQRESEVVGGRRGAARAGADLSARVPAARHADDPGVAERGRAEPVVLCTVVAAVERTAVIALFAAIGWFYAVQYAPRPVSLRGCAECRGEPDDVCEVRSGAQLQPIDEYPRPAAGRIKLLRPSAETACAVPAQKIVGPRAAIEL